MARAWPEGQEDATTLDRNLALDAVRITEAAALSAARLGGRGDPHGANDAAIRAVRRTIDSMGIRGEVVIGEGEVGEVEHLYTHERVGRGAPEDPEMSIALDCLEGSGLCARGASGAISVLAMAPEGHFLPAPDTYMLKLAVGPSGKGAIDLARPVAWNLQSVADAKGVYVEDLIVVILDRPRHEPLVRECREAGARIKLIGGGDISAAIATCRDGASVDMLVGTGGAQEGVIAAAALRCAGGDMQAQLKPRNHDEAERCRARGIEDLDRIYQIDDLARGDVLLAATGVTDGELLKGVQYRRTGAITHSVVMRSKTRTMRFIEAHHRFDGKPDYEM